MARTSTNFPGRFPTDILPRGVKMLIIANVAMFILSFFAYLFRFADINRALGLVPQHVLGLRLWELVTYLFVHDIGGPGHILFNMLTLWMFGSPMENAWGTDRFYRYYFLCGIGAGLCVVAVNVVIYLFNPGAVNLEARTIGASGAILGVLLAFGLTFPDARTYLWFFPIKAKYLVMITAAIEFMFFISASGSGVSHVAHLGGMLFGFIYLRSALFQRTVANLGRSPRGSRGWFSSLKDRYRDWKLARRKREFQVYMRKQQQRGRGPGDWVN